MLFSVSHYLICLFFFFITLCLLGLCFSSSSASSGVFSCVGVWCVWCGMWCVVCGVWCVVCVVCCVLCVVCGVFYFLYVLSVLYVFVGLWLSVLCVFVCCFLFFLAG